MMPWLDGVYEEDDESPPRKPRLHRTRAPTTAQLTHLADTIAHRVCRHLARKGWLEGEEESVFLTDSAGGDDGMDALRMSSITYRIATGAQAHEGAKLERLCRCIKRLSFGRDSHQPQAHRMSALWIQFVERHD